MPKLAYQTLNVPDQAETIAYSALEAVFTRDPTLKQVVKQWSVWSGDASDLWEPSWSTCPFFRLSPAAGPSDWVTESQHGTPIMARIQLAVQGTDHKQIMNFWGVTRRALFPASLTAKQTIMTSLQAAGISKPTISQPAYGVTEDQDNSPMMIAEGMIRLTVLIQT